MAEVDILGADKGRHAVWKDRNKGRTGILIFGRQPTVNASGHAHVGERPAKHGFSGRAEAGQKDHHRIGLCAVFVARRGIDPDIAVNGVAPGVVGQHLRAVVHAVQLASQVVRRIGKRSGHEVLPTSRRHPQGRAQGGVLDRFDRAGWIRWSG